VAAKTLVQSAKKSGRAARGERKCATALATWAARFSAAHNHKSFFGAQVFFSSLFAAAFPIPAYNQHQSVEHSCLLYQHPAPFRHREMDE